jgi:hypothetical protein
VEGDRALLERRGRSGRETEKRKGREKRGERKAKGEKWKKERKRARRLFFFLSDVQEKKSYFRSLNKSVEKEREREREREREGGREREIGVSKREGEKRKLFLVT